MNDLTSYSSEIYRTGAYDFSFETRRKSNNALEGDRLYGRNNYGNTTDFRIPRTAIPDMDSTSRASEVALFGEPGWNMLSIEQVLLAKALEKASSPDTLALVTMAELHKTVALVTSAARSVNKMASILESLGPSRVRALDIWFRQLQREVRGRSPKAIISSMLGRLDGVVRAAAVSWLGYRYGVMATVYDLESWIEASSANPKRVRTVCKQQTNWNGTPTVVNRGRGPGAQARWGPAIDTTVRSRISISSAGVLVKANLFSDDALKGMNRFGVNRYAESIWELIPLSFVLDWVLDIGTRIAAFEGSLYVTPLGSWVSHEHNLFYSRIYDDPAYTSEDATYRYSYSGGNAASVIERCVYRVRKANPPLSPIPQVAVRLNWKRLADAISLLAVGTSAYRNAVYRSIRV